MPPSSDGPYLRAFVSSTFVDLVDHRKAVIEFLRKSGIVVDPMEDWTAGGEEPRQLSTQRVEGCDLCVLLVAFRRGFVPPGQTLSITQQEYEKAKALRMEILVFLLDEEAPWWGKYNELNTDAALRTWREELRTNHTVDTFGLDPSTIPIQPAVARWLQKLRAGGRATPVDELQYVGAVHRQTAWIPIRGLHAGTGRAHRFPIRELFIPLSAAGGIHGEQELKKGEGLPRGEDRADLHESLREPRLVIVGDPGAGKTTFLRRIACELCELFPGIGQAERSPGDQDPTRPTGPTRPSKPRHPLPVPPPQAPPPLPGWTPPPGPCPSSSASPT